jgi:DNA adenine methylase
MDILIRYPGGKFYLLNILYKFFPNNYRSLCYAEPFLGSGKVFFNKDKSKVEAINDKDDYIINAIRVIKYKPDELKEYLSTFNVSSRSEFNRVKNKLINKNFIDDVEKAYCFLYYLNFSFGSFINGFKAGYSRSIYSGAYSFKIRLIDLYKERLKNVYIENLDFKDFIKLYDSEHTFFYLDPPYYDIKGLYNYSFEEKNHLDLYNILKNIKGKFLLSYNDCDFIRDTYKDFNIYSFDYFSRRSLKYYKEVLIYNYDINLENALNGDNKKLKEKSKYNKDIDLFSFI